MKFSFVVLVLSIVSAYADGLRDSIAIKHFTAGARCNHHLAYLAIDYPINGPSFVVEPIRDWMDSVVSCNGRIRKGKNPAKNCFECVAENDESLKAAFDVEDPSVLGDSYDSTWVVYRSQTKSTMTYEVQSSGYALVAAHGWYNSPTFVLMKGEARSLAYYDIFAFPKKAMIRYVRELARTEPSNQHECGARAIDEIDHVYPTSRGLAFQWHTYAVNCGACGNVVLILPYERFRGMFTRKFYELLPEFTD